MGGPEHGDAVGEAVDAHAVFRVRSGLLQPQYGSIVGFFDVNETVGASDVLKCFEFLRWQFQFTLIHARGLLNYKSFRVSQHGNDKVLKTVAGGAGGASL